MRAILRVMFTRFLIVALVLVSAALTLPATAETLTVTSKDCGHVVEHTPDASVAYQPGVAADGRQVAPADLNGSFTVEPPKSITIDIQIDPAKLPANAGQYLSESTIGKVEVKDGKVYYNGQEINSGISNAVAAACRQLKKK